MQAERNSRDMTVVDLSQEIYQGMPVFPGHLNTVIWDFHTHESTVGVMESDLTYATRGMILSDHGPTHVDSLSHFDPREGAPTIDKMGLDLFCGPAICIDIGDASPRTDVEPDRLEAAVAASGQAVRPGDTLLMRTGNYERNGGTAAYLSEYPGLSEASAEWLVRQRVKAFGVDCPSPDNPASRIYPVHLVCRREGLHHYENLGGLEAVVGKRFTFFGLPLRFRGGHGSPVRAVAILEG